MAKNIKKENTDNKEEAATILDGQKTTKETKTVTPNDLEWTDHVLSLLSEDEKIKGNPTTDGLRRIFEVALNCVVVEATSDVVQTPDPNNEKRATVVHTLSYVLKGTPEEQEDLKYRSVSGSADVYWGNCDKVYRNHPVAVAETRAEGRALRRALKLRKVIAAEEMAEDIEDHPDQNSVSKITNNQINFIDVIAKRLNINVTTLLKLNGLESVNIYSLDHEDAVKIIRLLSSYQQDMNSIPSETNGYNSEWK